MQSTAYFFDPPRAFSRCYRKTYRSQLTQPCIPPGSLNRVPASAGQGQGGNVSSAGWQVTLCDPMWHASSRSGVAALRTAIHSLLTYLLPPGPAWNGPCCRVCGGACVCVGVVIYVSPRPLVGRNVSVLSTRQNRTQTRYVSPRPLHPSP